jgi:hypothetical protein
MTREAKNDLFQSTFIELHQEAPAELLNSLRGRLEHIRANNPQSAQTAEACLRGLAADNSTLLHVLTAAYLINGGVMLKHNEIDTEATEEREEKERDFDFSELEEELKNFSDAPERVAEPVGRAQVALKPHRKNMLSTD